MWALLSLIASFFGVSAALQEQQSRGGVWPKFLFALAFAAMEGALVLLPFVLGGHYPARYFLPAFLGTLIVALANFGWFVPVMWRWKLPNRPHAAPVAASTSSAETKAEPRD